MDVSLDFFFKKLEVQNKKIMVLMMSRTGRTFVPLMGGALLVIGLALLSLFRDMGKRSGVSPTVEQPESQSGPETSGHKTGDAVKTVPNESKITGGLVVDATTTKAWEDGFRPAFGVPYDQKFSAYVIDRESNQPIAGASVSVTYVLDFVDPRVSKPSMSNASQDDEGVQWATRFGSTDEKGFFEIPRLPLVQMKFRINAPGYEIHESVWPVPSTNGMVYLEACALRREFWKEVEKVVKEALEEKKGKD